MKRIPLIIDTDPGHDDAIAIMTLLASPELVNILGIVTVAGNQTIDKVTANLLKVMELTGSQIPVARGAAGPLKRKLHTGEIGHGDSGMDGPDLPVPERGPDSQDGLLFTPPPHHGIPGKSHHPGDRPPDQYRPPVNDLSGG